MFAFSAASAQTTPTLPQLVSVLQLQSAAYVRSLPNLYADEHVLSEIKPHFSHVQPSRATVDSVFRIRRPDDAKTLSDLKESRSVKLLNGRPYQDALGLDATEGLPLMILRVFSNALAIFSANTIKCLDLTLAPVVADSRTLTLAFASRSHHAGCEDLPRHGEAILDRDDLRVRHIEVTIPNYPIYPQMRGTWTWAVEYALWDIAGREFSLPARIHSVSVADEGHAELLFDATYANYHRLTTNSRIFTGALPPPRVEGLPDELQIEPGAPPPPPPQP